MKITAILSLLLFASVGTAQLTSETIDINGNTRSYYRYLPTGYTSAEILPVVVVLHGIGDVASNMANVGFNQIADTARFIPVYLQGENNGWGQSSWNNGTLLASTAEDVFFISSVIDELEDSLDVDLSRVYCTGFSMGGIMTYRVASQLSDRIAAIASFSGTMSAAEESASGQLFPIPTLHVHGTADATVPYSGTPLPSLTLVQETIDKSKSLNTFAGDSTIYNLNDTASDGITIDKIVYNTSTPLELWKMNNADHIWPYQPVNDTSAIYAAWYWFNQFQHPNPSTASIETEVTAMDFSVYPNPVKDELTVKLKTSQDANVSITLLDVLGREVKQLYAGANSTGQLVVSESMSEMPQGIYFVRVSSNNSVITRKVQKL